MRKRADDSCGLLLPAGSKEKASCWRGGFRVLFFYIYRKKREMMQMREMKKEGKNDGKENKRKEKKKKKKWNDLEPMRKAVKSGEGGREKG